MTVITDVIGCNYFDGSSLVCLFQILVGLKFVMISSPFL